MQIRIELNEREIMAAVATWLETQGYKVSREADNVPKYAINAAKPIEATVWAESALITA